MKKREGQKERDWKIEKKERKKLIERENKKPTLFPSGFVDSVFGFLLAAKILAFLNCNFVRRILELQQMLKHPE